MKFNVGDRVEFVDKKDNYYDFACDFEGNVGTICGLQDEACVAIGGVWYVIDWDNCNCHTYLHNFKGNILPNTYCLPESDIRLAKPNIPMDITSFLTV